MNLGLHLFIHFSFAVLAGFFVWRLWRKPMPAFFGGLLGGVLIDFDHFIDYAIAFGLNFKLAYFTNSYYSLKDGKFFYLLHGWEYVAIFLLVAFLVKKQLAAKSFFLAVALGMGFHLMVDTLINEGMRPEGYLITYRIVNRFNLEKIVTPQDYQRYLLKKREVNFSK